MLSLEPAPCEPLSFTVAAGQQIICRHKLNFELNIQGATFDISAYIMPDCGAASILMGTKTLNDLEATMDFARHTLRVKKQKNQGQMH